MSNAALVRELEQLKARIAEHKNSRARLEGSLDAAMAELKRLGCRSVAEAEKKAAKLQSQADELQEKISNGLVKIREEFGW